MPRLARVVNVLAIRQFEHGTEITRFRIDHLLYHIPKISVKVHGNFVKLYFYSDVCCCLVFNIHPPVKPPKTSILPDIRGTNVFINFSVILVFS